MVEPQNVRDHNVIQTNEANLRGSWNEILKFWSLNSLSLPQIQAMRIAVCCCSALWFLSFWTDLPVWFGSKGILNSDLAALLVEFEGIPRWQMWSPLWWTDELTFYRIWLMLGVSLSGLCATRIGGRFAALALWLVAIAWSHRIVWLAGQTEPLLMSWLGYMVLFPNTTIKQGNASKAKEERNKLEFMQEWCIGPRLLQVHVWLAMLIGLLSQLASLIWWRGDAIWWLAAAGRSRLFSEESLQDSPRLVNLLTHGVIFWQVLALWLLATKSFRKIGVAIFGAAYCLSAMLVWDQALYAITIACGLIAFWPNKIKQD